jgi:hypothetical protein
MAIDSTSIRTRQAAVPGQVPEGGGRIHPTEYVVHHEIGNLLPALTEIDRAGGRVDLCKAYLSIETAGSEQVQDAYTFIDEAPLDSLVDAVLLRPAGMLDRAGHTDERSDALSYAQAYQVGGALSPWHLRGLHVAGTQTIFLWSRTSLRLPRIGQTLYLVQDEGGGGEQSQYVQITGMTYTDDLFQRQVGEGVEDYIRRIYQVSISSRLSADLTGPEVSFLDPADPDVVVRECVVAEGYHYFGKTALSAAASESDALITVDDVYAQVSPVARVPVQIADAAALTAGDQVVSSNGVDFTVSGPVHTYADLVTAGNRIAAWPPRTVAPIPAAGGNVHVHVRILGAWYQIVEGESSSAGTVTVNRTSGTITASFTALPDVDSYVLFEWPAAIHYTDRAGSTDMEPVRMRGTLASAAEPGTFAVSWLSNAVQKTASAGTDGFVTGDCAGYLLPTGEWWLEFSANLPDGDSNLTIDYTDAGTSQETFDPLTPSGSSVTFTLADLPVPGSLRLDWEVQQQIERLDGYDYPALVTSVNNGSYANMVLMQSTAEAAQWGSTERRTIARSTGDDGSGTLEAGGTVSYANGDVSLTVIGDYDYRTYAETTETWEEETGTETFRGRVVATYQIAGGGQAQQEVIPVEPLVFRLFPSVQDSLIPGTLRFSFGGVPYSDRDGGGVLYLNDGAVVGAINYVDSEVSLGTWSGTGLTVSITTALTTFGQWTLTDVAFRTAADELVTGSFQLLATETGGNSLSATDDGTGAVQDTGIDGTIAAAIGVCQATFDNAVWSGSITYNATASSIVPLDPDIIGIDPVRLPPDGRVLKIRSGDYLCIWADYSQSAPNPVSAGQTISLPNDNLAFVVLQDGAGEEVETLPSGIVGAQVVALTANGRLGPLEYCVLEDADGNPVNGSLYTADLDAWSVTFADPLSLDGYQEPLAARYLAQVHPDDYDRDLVAGDVTMANPLDLTGYTQPLTVISRGQDILPAADVQHTGQITLLGALSRDYAQASGVASLLLHGDLGARVANKFEQHTWSTTWLDYLSGDPPTGGGRYDDVAYPILVTNDGAIRERWRIRRRSDAQWDVVGENLGVIQVWDGVSTLEAKRVPSQSVPFFTLYQGGLGAGWSTDNFIQFETYAAQAPFWVLRCTRPGAASTAVDRTRLRHRLGAE